MFIYSKFDKVPLTFTHLESNLLSPRVHPQLFHNQVQITQQQAELIKDRIWNPKFFPTLKLLVKSLINALRL